VKWLPQPVLVVKVSERKYKLWEETGIISSTVRNLRDGAVTRYEHFEKIKGRFSLKYCVLPGRRQKKTCNACSMHLFCNN
jgi:hypothetical protein